MGIKDLKNKFERLGLHHDQSIPSQKPFQVKQSQPQQTNSSKEQSQVSKNDDIFSKPIATNEPPKIFARREHSFKPQGCTLDQPIQTNNFYNNLTLEDQTFPIWTLPYSLWLTKDPDQDHGFAFNHTDAQQRVFGPDPNTSTSQFYFNPPRIKSFVLSSENFDNVKLTLHDHRKNSVTARLENDQGCIVVPLLYGMGFITAIYDRIKPILASQVGVQEFKKVSKIDGLTKYTVKLFNHVVWSIYSDIDLQLKDPNHIVGKTPGTVQIARGDSPHYDETVGCYPTSCDISGTSSGEYSFNYNIVGKSRSGTTLVWALPHQQEVIKSNGNTDLTLDSPTKGLMKAYKTNSLIMQEQNLPIDISWDPWTSFATHAKYSSSAIQLIGQAATDEIQQDVVGMANIDSMYTSGKILDKFAYIAFVCHFILKDENLTFQILPKVKQAIEIFAQNRQKFPLVYDTTWKGLISSAEPGADFGNSNYNDHHFHYGYHIHAIALIAKIDEAWLHDKNNLIYDYAVTLLRDTASPQADEFFPQSRCFCWYNGHSFAHGIFASGDGKDEESSSEDYHFAYGMKLFANVIKDQAMESRANLMLAIMRRSMNMYMLFSNDNKIQPSKIISNKVSGILFENKIDYATYFGRGTIGDEWIHGIHMLPITPISGYIRNPKFVKEEWDSKLAPIIDRIPDGWKGILMLNKALFDPKSSYEWFARPDWNPAQIDNGMSRTWSLAYTAALLG
ncbi:ACF2 [Candida pseudojiufengensis]|uniref:ACF2 n=1 Tax=Candida pseudojiufengensis TaxID=497109 RepID=UPI002225667F|nr:ACF2 [Candida pseudojiufengensis]KAI5963069.1 ACF2 [Candida pseudojiufengensis]